MSEMIERVAKVLAREQHEELSDWHREEAIAAIEAMREPTDEMISASFKANIDPQVMLHKQRWQAMIDAALKEPK